MDGNILTVLLVVLLAFVLRFYRSSKFDFVNIHNRFLDYREGKFDGKKVTVLFRDYRTDLYAKGSFYESHAPCAAVYVCVDAKRQHYLWKVYEPTMEGPTLEKISAAEAQAMLSRKETLLSELCPKQK